MPTINVTTNVPGDRVTSSDVLSALSKAASKSIGKPEQWIMVSVTTDKPMCFAGTEEPCAFVQVISIGAIGGDKNKKISAALSEVLTTHLSVPAARIYIHFVDVEAADFGWKGSTFA